MSGPGRRPPVVPPDFPSSVIACYRGWYRLVERKAGWERAKFVLINDLSLSPAPAREFSEEIQVRRELERLLRAAPPGKSAERLRQSLFYLDQRPGERVTPEAVRKRGLPWRPAGEPEVELLRRGFQDLSRELIGSGETSKKALERRYEFRAGKPGIAKEIGALGRSAIRAVLRRFPTLAWPAFRQREVVSPAPWTNIVTYEGGIRLVANRGELADYAPGRASFVAMHEVCGHVLHFAQLLAPSSLRRTSPHLLCLSVHTYDAYFIEGIAQFMVSLYTERIEPRLGLARLDARRLALWIAVRHQNLSDLIEEKIDPRRAAERARHYLGGDAAVLRRTYEKMLQDAFFCCQMLVFHPAHQALLPALRLDDADLELFLGRLLGGHHSPAELDALAALPT